MIKKMETADFSLYTTIPMQYLMGRGTLAFITPENQGASDNQPEWLM
jgi:hypothetical protein